MTLTLREWETLPVADGRTPGRDEERLRPGDAEWLHALAGRAARRLGLPESAVLTRTPRGVRAGQVVGILATPRRTLEILPKIDGEDGAVRAALVRMLAVAQDLRVAEGELDDMDTQRHDLLEIFVRLFAARLDAALRRALPRHYVVHTEDLSLLRGRLDVTRQLTHLAARPGWLACRFDERSEDTPLNRVLKAAVSRLARLARSPVNVRRLTELAARLECVRDSRDPLREPVQLDRTNTALHDLYRLARLFLTGEWQSTASGGAAGFALLFPMNTLFEAFVGRSVKRAIAPCPVHLQHRGRHALIGADGSALFAVRPDVVIGEPADRPVILDAKWKRLTPRAPGCKATMGVARSDIYQMLAYAESYEAGRLILLYPWHGELGHSGRLRCWRTNNGTARPLDIVTIDVGCPARVVDTLRDTLEADMNPVATCRAHHRADAGSP